MKILLAVDDSKFSDAALQGVIAQIPPQGTEVLVLHVVEPIMISPPRRCRQAMPLSLRVG